MPVGGVPVAPMGAMLSKRRPVEPTASYRNLCITTTTTSDPLGVTPPTPRLEISPSNSDESHTRKVNRDIQTDVSEVLKVVLREYKKERTLL